MKNRTKAFFSGVYKHLGVYLFGVLIIPAIILTTSYYKTRIQEVEKFTLFFTTDKIENELLHEELNSLFKDYKLLQENQYMSSIVENSLDNYKNDLDYYGISLSDFIVVPESIATEEFLAYNVNSYKDYYENGISYGDANKVTYAIKVFDHTTQTGCISDIVHYELTDEDYYLCISKNSFHYNDYLKSNDSVLKTYINWMLAK